MSPVATQSKAPTNHCIPRFNLPSGHIPRHECLIRVGGGDATHNPSNCNIQIAIEK